MMIHDDTIGVVCWDVLQLPMLLPIKLNSFKDHPRRRSVKQEDSCLTPTAKLGEVLVAQYSK